MVRVVLNMIVKNESKIIHRCLESVIDVLDGYLIHDTGSSDNTISLIDEFMAQHKIPGRVESCPFKNFGFNRTSAFEAAQKWVQEQGWDPKETFALLIDADMLLRVKDWDKTSLPQADGWQIDQINPEIHYSNIRFLRIASPWKCLRRTHEYYSCEGEHKISSYPQKSIWMDDYGDGGSKKEKFQRDILLLLEDLADNPDDSRASYYLAQSYKDSGNFEEGLVWFRKRAAQRPSFEEERWYAQLQAGHCLKHLSRPEEAFQAYLKAYHERPTRVEPLHYIINYLLDSYLHQAADIFIERALKIPCPNDILFVEHRLYSHKIKFQGYLNSYYLGKKDQGTSLARELLCSKEAESVHWSVIQNLRWYVPVLADRKEIKWTSLRPHTLKSTEYFPCNPSLCTDIPKGAPPKIVYMAVCRAVDYQLTEERTYKFPPSGNIQTRNFLLALDDQLNILGENELIYTNPPYPHRVGGLEDMRLFMWKGKLHVIATSLEQFSNHVPCLCLCEIEYPMKGKIVMKPIPLRGYEDERCQKNWVPFVQKGHLMFLYDHTPTLLTFSDNLCKKVFSQGSDRLYTKFLRGSSGPIPFKLKEKGNLCVSHFHADQGEGRLYYHCFVFFNKDMTKIIDVSIPFSLRKVDVEFIIGMCLSPKGEVLLGCSLRDNDACIARIPAGIIRSLFPERKD